MHNLFQLDGEPGELHYKIFQLYGVILMCNNIFFYLTRETRDGTVPISIMTAKVFVSRKDNHVIVILQDQITFSVNTVSVVVCSHMRLRFDKDILSQIVTAHATTTVNRM